MKQLKFNSVLFKIEFEFLFYASFTEKLFLKKYTKYDPVPSSPSPRAQLSVEKLNQV